MIGKLRHLYKSKKLQEKRKILQSQAVINEMFEFGRIANFVNKTGNINNIYIGHHCRVNGLLLCETSGKIEIGSYCTIQDNVKIKCRTYIKIGHYVGIGDATIIIDHDDIPIKAEERVTYLVQRVSSGFSNPDPEDRYESLSASPIIIDDVVWIGAGCVISKGVRLGEACVVARNSVVFSDVPPYTIVAGNPAKVVKELKKPNGRYYEI